MKNINLYKLYDKKAPVQSLKYKYCVQLKHKKHISYDIVLKESAALDMFSSSHIKKTFVTRTFYTKSSIRQSQRQLEKIYFKDCITETELIFACSMMRDIVYKIYRLLP